MSLVIGVDIGTSSSKGVLVDSEGKILASAVREHEVSRPRTGWVEMPAETWWDEFCSIAMELAAGREVAAVGVSGMGPCVAVTDSEFNPLRPAILYGVDTRATTQIEQMEKRFGSQAVLERCGSALSTQAAGPKIAWIAENEPEVFSKAKKLFMPASWLGWKLTGEYVLDHHSASQCTPLYDTNLLEWYQPWASEIVGGIELPRLVWANEIIGAVSRDASMATGLPAGIPVVAGTIDAWSEAISVDAHSPGDLMLMYGTTMFLINTLESRVSVPELWGTVGAFEGSRSLAGGMATSGAVTSWLRELFGGPDYPTLLSEAAASPPGANGLLMLPYFAGERTPIADPDARGIIAGLTLQHTRGDIYRAALEAIAFGVRHNIEAIRTAGGKIERVVAVGGGTQGELWLQIVSDITGLSQLVPKNTIGASLGAAFLAASAIGKPLIALWNPVESTILPNPLTRDGYDNLFTLYKDLYLSSRHISHSLASKQT